MTQYQQMPMQVPQYGYQPASMYQQPMYGQVQQPYQSAYLQQNLQATQQRLQQMQQPQMVQQQQPQSQPIAGRFVNDEKEIVAGEVPMNGQMMFFPRADGQCIYGKFWTNDGKLDDVVFKQVPKDNAESAEPSKSDTDIILERLDQIEAMISSKQSGNRQQRNSSQKKEQINADA